MKRLSTAVLIASAVLLTTVSAAFASDHGSMPSDLSLWDQAVWEVQHYAIHMQMTFDGIRTWFASREVGWMLLDNQALCAEQGRLTAHLFDTGMHALISFFSTLIVLAWIGIEVAARVLAFLFRKTLCRVLATA